MNAFEKILRGYHDARKMGEVFVIHLSRDFYLQLMADVDFDASPKMQHDKVVYPIFGFVPVVDLDDGREFSFDFQGGLSFDEALEVRRIASEKIKI